MEINTTHPVLVTGATGYVAGWIIFKLLEQGVTVHATVRNTADTSKIQHLLDAADKFPGTIQFFEADLLRPGSFEAAMLGCEVVFHTASPFSSRIKDPQKDLIDPAVQGTKNVLIQANQTPSVKRVVLTSSCAAIYSDNADLARSKDGIFTEEDWNTQSSLEHVPYSYSKTLAEQEAWRIAGLQAQWDLVVINPSLVLGPPLNPKTVTSESIHLMEQFADGSMRFGVPNIGISVVDIRDLAEAHLLAAFIPEAKGRHIISGSNTDFMQLARLVKEQFPNKTKIKLSPVPKWLLLLVGPLLNKLLTKKYIRLNLNLPIKVSNLKSIQELGMTYRPLEETVTDTFTSLIQSGRI